MQESKNVNMKKNGSQTQQKNNDENYQMKLVNIFLDFENKDDLSISFLFKYLFKKELITEVRKCSFMHQQKGQISIKNCISQFDQMIISYFMDDNCYLAITESKNKKKEFVIGINGVYQKKGEIEDTWSISRVLVRKNRAFIFAEVRKIKILMINDYSLNSLVWFYYNHKNTGNEQILDFMHQDGLKYYIMEFKKKGVKITEANHNYDIQIDSSDIKDLKDIEIYNEDQKVMQFEMNFWDEKQIVNTSNHPTDLQFDKNHQFMTRLYFKGKNMLFEKSNNYEIMYFNGAQFHLNFQDLETADSINNQQIRISQKANTFEELFILTKNQFIQFKCIIIEMSYHVICNEIFQIPYHNIDLDKFHTTITIGNYIFLVFEELNEMRVLDKRKLSEITNYKFPEENQYRNKKKSYKSLRNHIYCHIWEDVEGEDMIRLYELQQDKIIVKQDFQLKVHEQIKEYQRQINLEQMSYRIEAYNLNKNKDYNILKLIIELEYNQSQSFYHIIRLNHNLETQELTRIKNDSDLQVNKILKKGTQFINSGTIDIFIFDEPKFEIIATDGQQLIHFPYFNVDEVIVMQKLRVINYLILAYKFENQYYYSLIKLTSDRLQQVIRQEKIEQFNKKEHQLQILQLSRFTLLIMIYNQLTAKITMAYLFFIDGPFLLGKGPIQSLRISQKNYPLQFNYQFENSKPEFQYNPQNSDITLSEDPKQENSYYINPINNEEENFIEIDIESHILFDGNLVSITVNKDGKIPFEYIEIQTPIRDTGEVKILNEDHDFDLDAIEERNAVFHFQDPFLIYKYQNYAQYYVYNLDFQYEKPIKFSAKHASNCEEIAYSPNAFYCFYYTNLTVNVKVHPLEDNRDSSQIVFELDEMGTQVRVLYEDDNQVIITMVHPSNTHLLIVVWDKVPERKVKTIKLDGLTLHHNEFYIFQYHATYHEQRNLLSIFVFNKLENKIQSVQLIFSQMSAYQYLSKELNLKTFGDNFIAFKCFDKDRNQFIWKCELTSSMKIIIFNFERKRLYSSSSPFIFEMTVSKIYVNPIQENVYLPGVNYQTSEIEDQYFFLTDINPFNKNKRIAIFKNQPEIKIKSYHIFQVPVEGTIKNIHAKINNKTLKPEIQVLVSHEGYIKLYSYEIGKYTITLQQPQKHQNMYLEFNLHFLQNNYFISLLINQPEKIQKVEEVDYNNFQRYFMTANLILIMICFVITYVLLIQIKKKSSLSIEAYLNMIEEELDDSNYLESNSD